MLLTKRKDLDMTNGPLLSTMIRFALPLMAANLISTMFNAMDIMVLSWFAEGNEVAAIGATSAVNALFSQWGIGLCVGVNIILARLLGRGDAEQVRRVVSTAILTGAMLGTLMAVVGIFACRPFLVWTNCPSECMDDAILASALYYAALPFMFIYHYAAAVIRVSGDSDSPLRFMIISGLANISLNAVFCVFFEHKVAAVAIATMISQALGAYLAVRHLMKTEGVCRFSFKALRFDFVSFRKMLWYGLPTAITTSIFPITNLQIQSAMNAFGADVLTGNVAATQYENIVANVGNAIGTSALTFIGQNIGAGKKDRVYKSFFYSAVLEFSLVFILSAVILIFGPFFSSIFGAGSGAALDASLLRMRVVVIFCFIALTPMPSTIQAFGYPQLQTMINLAGILGIRTLWMQVFYGRILKASLLNLYICYPLSYSILAVAYAIVVATLFHRYRSGKIGDKL